MMTSTPPHRDGTESLLNRNLLVLVGLWLLTAAVNSYIIVPASVFSVIIDDLGITAVAAGWLISIMFAGQVVGSVPTGIGLDRGNNGLGVAIGTGLALLVFTVGWQAAAVGNFALLLATRALGGVCFVLLWNAATNIVGTMYPRSHRATAIGVFTSCAPAGFALGHITGPAIVDRWGWPLIFIAYGLPVFVGYTVFYLAARNVEIEGGSTTRPGSAGFLGALTDRSVWYVAIIGFMSVSLYVFVNSWMPTYLVEERGLSLANGGLLIGVFTIVGVISRSGGGYLSDRVFGSRRRPVFLLTFGLSTPLILGIARLQALVWISVAVLFAGFFVQLATGILYAHIQEISDDAVSGTAIALLTGIVNVGSFLTPILAGWLITRVGWAGAFGYAGILGGAGFLLSLRLRG